MNYPLLLRASHIYSTKSKPGLLPIGYAQLMKWVASGRFPMAKRLPTGLLVWDANEVNRWLLDSGLPSLELREGDK